MHWGLLKNTILLLALMLLVCIPPLASAAPELKLTHDEARWLKDHPRIRIGMMDAWPPLNFVDKNGSPQGIGVDYVAAIKAILVASCWSLLKNVIWHAQSATPGHLMPALSILGLPLIKLKKDLTFYLRWLPTGIFCFLAESQRFTLT